MSSLTLQGLGMTSERTRERMIQRLLDQGISNQRVLTAMRQTPRHLFLDEALAHRAYEDTALPIGFRQTLSQPYIVAKMTECLLEAAPRLDKVLEIGTGSGYQAAVLAPLVTQLFSVERIQPLQEKARERLYQLKRHNVKLRLADGHLGLPAHAPYDAILSAAAPSSIPDALKQQLAPDGVLIIPVGEQSQQMTLLKRIGQTAEYQQQIVENVRFVPLLNGVVR